MVEDHEILRRYLKLGSMFLMGHSNGDSIVLGYAQRYPSHVEKLVLHDHELQGFDDKWHATHPVNIMELERFELFSTDTSK